MWPLVNVLGQRGLQFDALSSSSFRNNALVLRFVYPLVLLGLLFDALGPCGLRG
jgi:hypothetical protein